MINVGDVFIFKEQEWKVIELNQFDDSVIAWNENGEEGFFKERGIYKLLYEQQKQRADRAEKRWSELKDKVGNRYEYTTHNLVTWMHNKEEARQWSAAKHELLMVMKDMHDLEEDGE